MSLVGRLGRRRRLDESGFTLIELSVAMMVIAIVMAALAGLYVGMLKVSGADRQRQQATALASQVLEQLRALPYTTVTAGLYQSDPTLASDPNIVSGRFHPQYANGSIDEALATTSTANVAPLNPHQRVTTIGNTAFTVRDYVSQATDGGYWLTVIVSWTSLASNHASKTTAMRSEVFSPNGCLSSSTHPFSGVCQAFYYGQAALNPGSISIDPLTSGSSPISGINFSGATLSLPELLANTQMEQVSSVLGKVVTSGATIVDSSGASTSVGSVSASTLADTDPSSVAGSSNTASTGAQTYGPLSATGSGGTLSLQPTTSDSGSLVSTVAAGSSPACQDVTNATLMTGQPCGSGSVQASGSGAAATLDLAQIASRDLGAMTLASIGPAPAATQGFGGRFTAASGSYCPTASSDGCAVAAMKHSLGTVVLGGLPAAAAGDLLQTGSGTATDLASSGFAGMLQLSGYSDSEVAQAGVGQGTTSSSRAGTLQYWCGGATGYCSVNLATGSGSYSSSVLATYNANDGTDILISEQATITIGSQTTTSAPTSCTSSACTAIAQSDSPVLVTLTYQISHSGTTIGAFTVTVNLGRALAKATYKAAPSA